MTDSVPPSSRVRRTVTLVFRLGMTLFILYGSWLSFNLFRAVLSAEPPESYAAQRDRMVQELARRYQSPPKSVPWPRYPRVVSESEVTSKFRMNGVPILVQTMEVKAQEDRRVIDFYRRRMRFKGWKDVTESYFGLQPDAANCAGPRNLQDEDYLRRYQGVISSNLALKRRGSTLYVKVQSGSTPRLRRVELMMNSGHSMVEPIEEMGGRLEAAKHSDHPEKWLEYDSSPDGIFRNQTEFFRSASSPGLAFEDLRRRLEAEGWKEQVLPPGTVKMVAEGCYFAHYLRGNQTAMLSVSPGKDHGGSEGMVLRLGVL